MSIGPYRVMPARVRAGMDYLSYTMSIEHGCGEAPLARGLDPDELRTKRNVLRMLDQWFLGEQELADVLLLGHPKPPDFEVGEAIYGGDGPAEEIELEDDECQT